MTGQSFCTCSWSPVNTATIDPPHLVSLNPYCPVHGDDCDGPCDHHEAFFDRSVGKLECDICGARWYLTAEEIAAMDLREGKNLDRAMRRLERRGRRAQWWRWFVGLFKREPEVDEEIPF